MDEQQHYSMLGLDVSPRYTGPVSHLTVEEMQALFAELFEATGLPYHLPLPPKGLPGHFADPDPEIMAMVRDGVRYLHAICNGEKKTLWNIHERMAERLRQSYWQGRKVALDEVAERVTKEAMREVSPLAAATRQREAATFVYFIQSASGGIKIGSARDIGRRMKELQTAHPVKLEVLASTTGGQPVERAYHERFAAARLHGEWFSPAPEILAEIERLSV